MLRRTLGYMLLLLSVVFIWTPIAASACMGRWEAPALLAGGVVTAILAVGLLSGFGRLP
jgi:hypothetical protein